MAQSLNLATKDDLVNLEQSMQRVEARVDEERVLNYRELLIDFERVPEPMQALAPRLDDTTSEDFQGGIHYSKGQMFLEYLENAFGRDAFEPIVLVANSNQDTTTATVQLARIGYDRVVGVVTDLGGGNALATYRLASIADLKNELRTGSPQILDVRTPSEWEAMSIPGSFRRYVPDLRTRLPDGLEFALASRNQSNPPAAPGHCDCRCLPDATPRPRHHDDRRPFPGSLHRE